MSVPSPDGRGCSSHPIFTNTNPEFMHYKLKQSPYDQRYFVKTACARNVPKDEATKSRMLVTCETCLRYIEAKSLDSETVIARLNKSKLLITTQDKEGNFTTFEEKGKGGSRG